MTTTSTSGAAYRYDRFRLSHMLEDMRFDPETPTTGDRLPQLNLHTLDGEHITFEDLDRPHLFVFGSNTCPMTASARDVLGRLRAALTATIEGRTPDQRQSTRMLQPTLGALGHVGPVIDAAGPRARRDLLRSAPPMLLGARLAGLFRRISPNRRGHALIPTAGATTLVAVAVTLLL